MPLLNFIPAATWRDLVDILFLTLVSMAWLFLASQQAVKITFNARFILRTLRRRYRRDKVQ